MFKLVLNSPELNIFGDVIVCCVSSVTKFPVCALTHSATAEDVGRFVEDVLEIDVSTSLSAAAPRLRLIVLSAVALVVKSPADVPERFCIVIVAFPTVGISLDCAYPRSCDETHPVTASTVGRFTILVSTFLSAASPRSRSIVLSEDAFAVNVSPETFAFFFIVSVALCTEGIMDLM